MPPLKTDEVRGNVAGVLSPSRKKLNRVKQALDLDVGHTHLPPSTTQVSNKHGLGSVPTHTQGATSTHAHYRDPAIFLPDGGVRNPHRAWHPSVGTLITAPFDADDGFNTYLTQEMESRGYRRGYGKSKNEWGGGMMSTGEKGLKYVDMRPTDSSVETYFRKKFDEVYPKEFRPNFIRPVLRADGDVQTLGKEPGPSEEQKSRKRKSVFTFESEPGSSEEL